MDRLADSFMTSCFDALTGSGRFVSVFPHKDVVAFCFILRCLCAIGGLYKFSKDGAVTPPNKDSLPLDEIASALAGLRRDYSKLSPRVRELTHSIKSDCDEHSIRLHYPAFRQSQATVKELVDAIVHFVTPFCLPRSEIQDLQSKFEELSFDDVMFEMSRLSQRALDLFKKAQAANNRNGEAGELLLYLLTEWVLSAPQILAKMSLKTNSQMPVHGADGVHVSYSESEGVLNLYWGESKLYSDVGEAMRSAGVSISEGLKAEKLDHEIDLVRRNLDLSGLAFEAKQALLKYLDPFDETYNRRHDIVTCLIGFDFNGFAAVQSFGVNAEDEFKVLAESELASLSQRLNAVVKKHSLEYKKMEIFFFPLPSVSHMRELFQSRIGWSA